MLTDVRNFKSRFGTSVQNLGILQHTRGFAIDIDSYHHYSQGVYSRLPFSTSLDIMSSLALEIIPDCEYWQIKWNSGDR